MPIICPIFWLLLAAIFIRWALTDPAVRDAVDTFIFWAYCQMGLRPPDKSRYNFGTLQNVRDLYVDPGRGADFLPNGIPNPGTDIATPLQTIGAAWRLLPRELHQPYRINLLPGTYDQATQGGNDPIQLNDRDNPHYGNYTSPIIIQPFDPAGDPTRVQLNVGLDISDASYLYLLNLRIQVASEDRNDDALHVAFSDTVLISGCRISGGGHVNPQTLSRDTPARRNALKLNQCRYVYVEDCELSGATDCGLDGLAIHHGHVIDNEFHDCGDWGFWFKGGSADLRIERNHIHHCTTGGFTAGQGSGFQWMRSPWLYYEAYAIRFINNVIHDVGGAGIGVQGGYNILLAYNTICRVGNSGQLVVVGYGTRSCDDDPDLYARQTCRDNAMRGGWGPNTTMQYPEVIGVPNRHVFIYFNLIYNPPGYTSGQHFSVAPDTTNPGGSGLPLSVKADDDLRIYGNLIWNEGAASTFGEGPHGCVSPDRPCINTDTDNVINVSRPELVDADGGDMHTDFHPLAGGNLSSDMGIPRLADLRARAPVTDLGTIYESSLPRFVWDDAHEPATAVPLSERPGLVNIVKLDYDRNCRPAGGGTPGAFVKSTR